MAPAVLPPAVERAVGGAVRGLPVRALPGFSGAVAVHALADWLSVCAMRHGFRRRAGLRNLGFLRRFRKNPENTFAKRPLCIRGMPRRPRAPVTAVTAAGAPHRYAGHR